MARIFLRGLIFSSIMAFFATSIAWTEVDILYFLAKYQNNIVVLDWETDFEVDLNGFYVTRSNVQNGTYTRISSLIPSEGEEGFGSTYQFTDENISNNTTYWYQLEALDNDNRVTYSDLVHVFTGLGIAPTATGSTTALVTPPAGTPTATLFFSPLQTTPAGTSTPTAPFLPGGVTATISGPVTPTPMGAATLEATQVLSATTTLVPLPEITLQFPTPVADLDISSEGSAMKQEDLTEQERGKILSTVGRAIFIGFIVLIWLLLAVWFYFSSRRVE